MNDVTKATERLNATWNDRESMPEEVANAAVELLKYAIKAQGKEVTPRASAFLKKLFTEQLRQALIHEEDPRELEFFENEARIFLEKAGELGLFERYTRVGYVVVDTTVKAFKSYYQANRVCHWWPFC